MHFCSSDAGAAAGGGGSRDRGGKPTLASPGEGNGLLTLFSVAEQTRFRISPRNCRAAASGRGKLRAVHYACQTAFQS